MNKEVNYAGFGGQGVLTAGLVIANIAMDKDLEVSWMPAYGASMRGGKAYSVVKFGEDEIGTPNFDETDVVVAMNLPSLDFQNSLKKDGTVIVNTNLIDANTDKKQEGINYVDIPCRDLAVEVKNPKGDSIVMVGAACKLLGLEKAAAVASMRKFFDEKGKGSYNDANEAAFVKGYDFV